MLSTYQNPNKQKIADLMAKPGPDSLKQLITLLMTEDDPLTRSEGLSALKVFKVEDALAPLVSMLKMEDRKARMVAVEGLGELRDSRAHEHVTSALNDKDPGVRTKAVDALGRMGGKGASRALAGALHDRSAGVRILAAQTLGRLGDPAAVNFLISAMSEANTVARAPMADALGELGDERAIGSLVERLGDKTWDIQFAAAEAIGKIGGTQAAGALINWSKRIFSSELKKISAAEKSVLVGEVMSSFFKKLKDDELQSITAKLDDQVKIRSWLEAGDGAAPRWGDEIRENPVWAALKEEFSRRKSAPIHSPRTTQLANGERLFSPPDDEEVPLEELIEPAPVSEENSPANGAPIGHGPLKGIVADFLAFLEGQGQEDFVLVGGAVRDTILGRPPKDLDVTIQMKVSDELLAKRGDPMEWNLACSGHTNSALARLASVLNVSAGDLVHGRALFSSNGVSVPVHYVGPHLVEERRLTWRDLMVECKSHIVFSRIAMVADPARNRLTGLCGTTSVDHFWLDPHGRWCGESSRASADLRQKILQADSSPREARFWDLFRILYLKHLHGMTLSDSTVGILFRTAELLKANPDAAKTEFSQESFRRLVAAADLDHVVAELDLLDLLPALMDTLDASLLQDLNRIMMEKESRRTQS
ncbi:HEAT repeat domain-containing protein, partial [Candidatus Sumerlaeota bacterium]|nr:HEAT repeat domain-containing protein [Candidatus Sumerlaeota bacterium]